MLYSHFFSKLPRPNPTNFFSFPTGLLCFLYPLPYRAYYKPFLLLFSPNTTSAPGGLSTPNNGPSLPIKTSEPPSTTTQLATPNLARYLLFALSFSPPILPPLKTFFALSFYLPTPCLFCFCITCSATYLPQNRQAAQLAGVLFFFPLIYHLLLMNPSRHGFFSSFFFSTF